MRKLLILAMAATMIAASCTRQKVNGVVVMKTKATTEYHRFYILSVKMGEDTIDCNVSHAVYKKYDVGDSVHEKGRYWATSAE